MLSVFMPSLMSNFFILNSLFELNVELSRNCLELSGGVQLEAFRISESELRIEFQ